MIIVTGGAGFIGSALVAGLNQRGIKDIIIVDELGTDDKWKNLRNLQYSDYIEKDDFLHFLSDEPEFNVEAILHMGACSSTTETDCSYLVKNNYEYSTILANWADSISARFIYASSAATYGDGKEGFSDDHALINKLQPLNMYGYSKHMFDQWAMRTGMVEKIVGLKFFNVYGPNEYHKAGMISFVLRAFNQINETGKVKLFKSHNPDYKDGEFVRDFIYIKDVVEMVLFFLDNDKVNGIFNIGTAKARSWNDLAKATFNAMGRDVNIEYVSMPEHLRDKYQYFTQADISKIQKAGYDKPITSLEDAVKDYVCNYLCSESYLTGTTY